MTRQISGQTRVAGVVGQPVTHSLSPRLHNAWLQASGLDGVYVSFAPPAERFGAFVEGMRGGTLAGLNVTAPFKERALNLADEAQLRAQRAGAANILLFHKDGRIEADNSDGEGLLGAFAAQAPGHDLTKRPAAILGAGGAARGAAAALLAAGVSEVFTFCRRPDRGLALAQALPGLSVQPEPGSIKTLARRIGTIINATPAGLEALSTVGVRLTDLGGDVAVMDMVYRPLETPLLQASRALGHTIVDGLEMLICQARPSFAAFFGSPAPDIDSRAVALSL